MGSELIRPLDEETAKAVQQTAILGQKAFDAGAGAGGYLAGVLGRLPHNLVGIIDDHVVHFRARRWIEMNEDLTKDLLDRGIKERIEPSLTVLMPLLEGAVDENRAELKKLWRRLLANAYDPSRAKRIRSSFIEIAKALDPLDALVLERMLDGADGQLKPSTRDYMTKALAIPTSEVMLSFSNLKSMDLIWNQPHELHHPMLTDKGRLFLAAVAA